MGLAYRTEDYTPEVYTAEGLAWIDDATMKSVLLRHYPELASTGLANVTNAFYPWGTDIAPPPAEEEPSLLENTTGLLGL